MKKAQVQVVETRYDRKTLIVIIVAVAVISAMVGIVMTPPPAPAAPTGLRIVFVGGK